VIGVVGEALIDLVPASCDGEPGLVPRAGGSPFNVAVGAARLGAPTAFLGRVSTDAFGELLTSRLLDEGVSTEHVVATDEPTTLAVVSLDEDGVASYGFYLEGTSAFGLTAGHVALPDDVTIVHASCGAVLLDTSPAGDALRAALASDGALTSFDPNVRPQFVRDLDAYRAVVTRTVASCDLVKVSDEDLEVLHPDADPLEVARAWAGSGPPLVIVTRGPDGATAVHADRTETVEVAGRDGLTVADTVGAGDSFSGALLTWLHGRGIADATALRALSGDDLAEALTFARDVAAVTVTRVGADPPRRNELGSR
jgi:fructokinase